MTLHSRKTQPARQEAGNARIRKPKQNPYEYDKLRPLWKWNRWMFFALRMSEAATGPRRFDRLGDHQSPASSSEEWKYEDVSQQKDQRRHKCPEEDMDTTISCKRQTRAWCEEQRKEDAWLKINQSSSEELTTRTINWNGMRGSMGHAWNRCSRRRIGNGKVVLVYSKKKKEKVLQNIHICKLFLFKSWHIISPQALHRNHPETSALTKCVSVLHV